MKWLDRLDFYWRIPRKHCISMCICCTTNFYGEWAILNLDVSTTCWWYIYISTCCNYDLLTLNAWFLIHWFLPQRKLSQNVNIPVCPHCGTQPESVLGNAILTRQKIQSTQWLIRLEPRKVPVGKFLQQCSHECSVLRSLATVNP